MNDNNKFTVVCAWCKKVMYQAELEAEISHGICEKCYIDQIKENRRKLK